jgi:hypothetical protein
MAKRALKRWSNGSMQLADRRATAREQVEL